MAPLAVYFQMRKFLGQFSAALRLIQNDSPTAMLGSEGNQAALEFE